MDALDCVFCRTLNSLAALPETELIGSLPHSVVLLGQWQYFQGHCLVVARRHATELSQLDTPERLAYFEEMCLVARALELAFHPHKLNYELLGNQVPHLHWHLFPRYRGEPQLLKPVWIELERAEQDPSEKHRLQTGPNGREETAALLRRKLTELAPDKWQA